MKKDRVRKTAKREIELSEKESSASFPVDKDLENLGFSQFCSKREKTTSFKSEKDRMRKIYVTRVQIRFSGEEGNETWHEFWPILGPINGGNG